jgi:hypothetical protein
MKIVNKIHDFGAVRAKIFALSNGARYPPPRVAGTDRNQYTTLAV